MTNKEIKVLYVSIPYSGHEDTFPTRCEAAKKKYHKEGCRVITPADIIKDSATPYSQCMGKCIEVLLECDEVVFLSGWYDSKGCNLEHSACQIYNIPYFTDAKL